MGTLLSKTELTNFLKSDPDNYYSTFTDIDLHARGVSSVDEYISILPQSTSSFTQKEQQRIIAFASEIDEKCKTFHTDCFNGKKAAKMLWIFGCVKGDVYEGGLPHTRNGVIILQRDCIDRKTLIHEKVHVYQKKHAKDRRAYLSRFNKMHRKGEMDRANPDTDRWIYGDQRKTYRCMYRTSKPKSIQDVIGKNEHPLEEMAYKISNLL